MNDTVNLSSLPGQVNPEVSLDEHSAGCFGTGLFHCMIEARLLGYQLPIIV
jgi:hypothetical protein